ncbi:MAG: MFS transporter [Clostridiales bacterium]|nr:MFS transporter [Clostridiales bacterium]
MSDKYKRTLFCCSFGAMIQAFIINLAPTLFIVFSSRYGFTYEQIGRIVLFNFVTQLIIDLLAARFIHHIKKRTAVLVAQGFTVVGMVLMSLLPVIIDPYMGIIIATITYAIGGGLAEVLYSPIVDSIPSEHKSGTMAMMHSYYCWGSLIVVAVTTLMLTVTGSERWHLIPLFWAIFPAVNGILFAKAPIPPSNDEAPIAGITGLFRKKGFALAAIVMLCSGASELVMSQWASMFAEQGLGVGKVMGDLLGPGMFAVTMGTGRMIYALFGKRLNMNRMLVISGLFCIVCYLTAVFAPNPLISLLGCALSGFSVSLMWPGTLSVTSERIPGGGVTMFAILALFGDIGCSLGPWVTGIISDLTVKAPSAVSYASNNGMTIEALSLKLGILAGIVFPIALTLMIFAQNREKRV